MQVAWPRTVIRYVWKNCKYMQLKYFIFKTEKNKFKEKKQIFEINTKKY